MTVSTVLSQLGALGNARSTRVQTAALAALDAAVMGGCLRNAECSPPILRCATPCSMLRGSHARLILHPLGRHFGDWEGLG